MTGRNGSAPPSLPHLKDCWFWAGWEPDRYYRRIGARGTPFFGNGDWIADWRARLESADCLEAVRDAGGTILITRFSKGFGPAVDSKDWDSLRSFVKLAHEYDLKVWGYLQGQSLFGEFIFPEKPEAAEWIARAFDGSRRTWGGATNRFAPCLGSGGYREMAETLVEQGLSRVGLDGLHLDNSYYSHCYCPRCKELFREWLAVRGDLERLTGIEHPDFVEPPPLCPDADILPDPLAILWIEFGVRQRLDFLKALRKKIKQTAPHAHFTGNPAFLRSYAPHLTHGYDPALEAGVFDSVCVENGNRPRFADGILFTQADKHLMAEAAGLRTWITSWSPKKDGSYGPPPDAQSLWAGVAEEFSFHHAYLGNNWALRPLGDAEGLLMDSPQWDEFQNAVRWFRDLDEKRGGETCRQWGELAVYVDSRALSLCPASDGLVLQAVIEQLLHRRIPFKIVFPGQPLPPETRTVLIAGQRAFATQELKRLAAQPHIEILLLGDCAIYDEWMVPRGAANRRRLLDAENIRSFSFPLPLSRWIERGTASAKYFRGKTPSFSAGGRAALVGFFDSLAVGRSVQITAPAGVLANVEILGESQLWIHIRDLRENATRIESGEVKIKLRTGIPDLPAFSPEWKPGFALPGSVSEGTTTFHLPMFRHYAGLLACQNQLLAVHIKK